MQKLIRFIYMGFLPFLYLVAIYGVLKHNNWFLDTMQTVLLVYMGFMVLAAFLIVNSLPRTKKEVNHE